MHHACQILYLQPSRLLRLEQSKWILVSENSMDSDPVRRAKSVAARRWPFSAWTTAEKYMFSTY